MRLLLAKIIQIISLSISIQIISAQQLTIAYGFTSIQESKCSNFVSQQDGPLKQTIYDNVSSKYITENCIIQCINNPSYNFNALLITQGQTYKNSLLITDPHYRVRISFLIISLDDKNLSLDNLYINANNINPNSITFQEYNNLNFNSDLCEGQQKEKLYFLNIDLSHSDTSNLLVLQITNKVNSPNKIAIKSTQIIIQQCLPGCAECLNSYQCTKCLPRSSLKLGSQCITYCGDGKYINDQGTCSSCYQNCQTCFGPDQNQCLSCKGNLLLNEQFQCSVQKNKCSQPLQIYNQLFNTCITFDPSQSNCQSITNNICSQCKQGYNLADGNCASSNNDCPFGYYYELNSQKCQQNGSNCLLQIENKCISCQNQQPSQQFWCGQKINNIQNGYFFDKLENSFISCQNNCQQCSGLFLNSCSQCISGYSQFYGECIYDCQNQQQYYDEKTQQCQKCDSNCMSCFGTSNNQCFICKSDSFQLGQTTCLSSCPIGYYELQSPKSCQACIQNCDQCSSSKDCQKCSQGYFFDFQTNLCSQTCSNGYFADIQSQTCLQCTQNCDQCTDTKTCGRCINSYFLLNNQSCIDKCPDGYFSDIQKQICSNCPLNCQICSSSNTCSQCDQQTYLLNNQSCVLSCPSEYQIDQQLRICKQISCQVSNCNSCQNTSLQKCQFCDPSYNLQPIYSQNYGQCLNNCPDGYYPQNQVCNECQQNCNVCTQQFDCIQCSQGFSILQNLSTNIQSCISNSDCTNKGYYLDSTQNICFTCMQSQCANCQDNKNTCKQCQGSYYLFNQTCVSQCSDGYIGIIQNGISVCQKCDQLINGCSSCLSETVCVTCISGYNLYSQKCLQTCPDGFIKLNGMCTQLNINNCIKYNLDQCVECSNSFQLIQNSCQLQCSQTEILNSLGTQCIPLVCPQNQIIYQNQCVVSCPQGTQNYQNICLDQKQLKLTLNNNQQQNSIIILLSKGFDNEIKSNQNVTFSFSFQPNLPYNVTQTKISNDTYLALFNFKNNPPTNLKLTVSVSQTSQASSDQISQSIVAQFSYQISESTKKATDIAHTTGQSVSQSIIISSLFLIFTSYQPLLSSLVDLSELFYLLTFLNILQIIF
ncbi:hypothetical protein ABPG74_003751 [Tetrahymena malaccensis]